MVDEEESITPEEKKTLEEKLDKLTNIVQRLAEMQYDKAMKEEERLKQPSKEDMKAREIGERQEKEELLKELQEHPLGEIVIFALKRNLIKRGSSNDEEKE